MLGEGALTLADARRYLQAYRDAIHAIGKSGNYIGTDVFAAPSISRATCSSSCSTSARS